MIGETQKSATNRQGRLEKLMSMEEKKKAFDAWAKEHPVEDALTLAEVRFDAFMAGYSSGTLDIILEFIQSSLEAKKKENN